jgi:hypothetical protein
VGVFNRGREEKFLRAWDDLARIFTSLPSPPISGTLIRHATERTLFYSFGPWRSATDVQAMRAHLIAVEGFARLAALCMERVAGDYELVRHVDVAR